MYGVCGFTHMKGPQRHLLRASNMLLRTHIRRSGSGNNIQSNKSTEVGHTNTLFLKRLFAGYPLANKNIFAGAPPANKD